MSWGLSPSLPLVFFAPVIFLLAGCANIQLANAARSGNIPAMQVAFMNGANDSPAAMHAAINADHIDAVKLLLANADTNMGHLYPSDFWRADVFNDALTYASKTGHYDIVRLLTNLRYRKVGVTALHSNPPQGTVPISAPISVNTPDYRGEKRPDDFAVVVGVEKYAQNLPKAEFADEDARAFRAHLIALGVPARHIVYLSDERASRSELVKNIERWLPKNVKPNSRVYFYFSGHGAPDPATGNAYLVGFDGDPSDLSDTAYPLSRLYANLGKLKARHVVVALDSCFSGAGGRSVIAEGTRPLVNRVKEGVIPRNGKLIVLTASKSDQSSGILKDKRHGTFTYYLLKGLNGKALDSKNHVTINSLYSYLAPKVEDAAHLDDRDQDPQMAPKTRSAGGLTLR